METSPLWLLASNGLIAVAIFTTEDFDGDGILNSNHQTAAVSLTGLTAADEYFEGFDEVDLFLSGKNLRDFLEDLAAAGAI